MSIQKNQKSLQEKHSLAISTIASFSGLSVNEVVSGFENRV